VPNSNIIIVAFLSNSSKLKGWYCLHFTAVDGFEPYKQANIVKELRKHLTPNGV
jgi:hypothetical protein